MVFLKLNFKYIVYKIFLCIIDDLLIFDNFSLSLMDGRYFVLDPCALKSLASSVDMYFYFNELIS